MTLNLHPEALADLRRSGLTDETIAAAGVHTPAPGDLDRLLGARLSRQVTHVLVFPYPGAGDFARLKLFPPVPDGQGHTIRYYQPPGTPPRLYLPARARAAIADPAVALFVTEGEKKALKADQDGLACLAVGGLWSWRHQGAVISDLDAIDWFERPVVLAPDSDVWTRPDLLQPVYALGRELEGRGAKVTVLKLPAGPEGGKVGLDDRLCAHGRVGVESLPRLPLRHPLFSRAAAWWREWSRRTAEEAAPATDEPGPLELLERSDEVRLVHPAQDVIDGVLWYGVPTRGRLVLVSSTRQSHRDDGLPADLALRHSDPGPSTVRSDLALRWLKAGATGTVARTVDGIAAFLSRYVVLRDPPTALWLATWALATWCYRAFRVFPYLSIRSVEKRCGKSRLLGLLQRVTFNASPVTAHPTEAQLYRAAARTGGVQLLDEVETLRGDRERFDALITVLNVGFERGGVVSRLEKRGDRFVEEPYEVYAPRVLAGIAGLKDTLEDRALTLMMIRRRRTEPVARLGPGTDAEAQALRDECALACLTRIADIEAAYELAPGVLERAAIDDRAVDLWSPLLAIAGVADREDGGDRCLAILDAAREQASAREADAEAGPTARLLEALVAIREQEGETVTAAALLEALRARSGWDWVKTPRRLAGLLNPLGIARRQLWNGGRRRWGYVLEAGQLADLQARYGAGGEEPAGDPGPPPAEAVSTSAIQ